MAFTVRVGARRVFISHEIVKHATLNYGFAKAMQWEWAVNLWHQMESQVGKPA